MLSAITGPRRKATARIDRPTKTSRASWLPCASFSVASRTAPSIHCNGEVRPRQESKGFSPAGGARDRNLPDQGRPDTHAEVRVQLHTRVGGHLGAIHGTPCNIGAAQREGWEGRWHAGEWLRPSAWETSHRIRRERNAHSFSTLVLQWTTATAASALPLPPSRALTHTRQRARLPSRSHHVRAAVPTPGQQTPHPGGPRQLRQSPRQGRPWRRGPRRTCCRRQSASPRRNRKRARCLACRGERWRP